MPPDIDTNNDPLVLAHARALMTSHPSGRTAFIAADLRQPQEILADATLRETLISPDRSRSCWWRS